MKRNLRRLQELVTGISLSTLIICTDMTNTLLSQSADGSGLSMRMRWLIRDLSRKVKAFIVCSGDSEDVVSSQLLSRLEPSEADCATPHGSIYTIAGSGATINVDEPVQIGRRFRNLFQLSPVPLAVRQRLLDRALCVIGDLFGQPISLQVPEREMLLSPTGGRIDVSDRVRGLDEELLLESGAKGFTAFLPQSMQAAGAGRRMLSALAGDQEIICHCAANGLLPPFHGPNFVDCVASHKGTAVRTFFTETVEGRAMYRDAPRVLVCGDSINDAELMSECMSLFGSCSESNPVLAFVGRPEDFQTVTGGGSNAIFLGENMNGTKLLFEELLHQQAVPSGKR